MSKETLSMREAKRILDESARAVNAFEKKIESGNCKSLFVSNYVKCK